MTQRIQSPSSINTYLQCPRKYFYQYELKLPTKSNVHQLRGAVAHRVLERFFDEVPSLDFDVASVRLRERAQSLLIQEWTNENWSLLNLPQSNLFSFFEETLLMLYRWVDAFVGKLRTTSLSFDEAFKLMTPIREVEYVSLVHSVRGIIDAIENVNGSVRIMDYKTSSSFDVEDHQLQLSIYALLYQEKHGRLPDQLGIYYLKGDEAVIPVDHNILESAKLEISRVHEKTKSSFIDDYPLIVSRLCKWNGGQCDFYDICFNGKSAEQYKKEVNVIIKGA